MAFVYVQSPAKANEVQNQVNTPMEWTKRHDIMLCREVLVVNPFQAKKKTTQRTNLWQTIADNLKKMEAPLYKKTLSKRSIQDRCSLLCEKQKKRASFEKRATGISPEVTELDQLVEEILEKEELSEETRKDESDSQKRKMEEDKESAVDIRKKAMERLSETKKRKADETENAGEKRKARRSSSDTIEFLREQEMMEMQLREKELELKKEQQEKDEQKQEMMMKMMAQQQQQQQMEQMQMMMAQQNYLMLAMIEKLSSKQ